MDTSSLKSLDPWRSSRGDATSAKLMSGFHEKGNMSQRREARLIEQLFHVAYILLKFANSPRPDLWVLERSVDNGRTFTPWQYFARKIPRGCLFAVF
ncbi:Laminin subunit alpha-3 [Liparis tanakae]|uniref:Laminin subunit alpha-3 n=1 Tax=Liparis tanakae TaxID=230148 RepID=A0A4Z2EC46_9TELE|nr:Laminin subunit alpha-3 [Liparis tanakae]